MPLILVTAAVFQLPMGWLNALAELNTRSMLVTAAVFQLPMLVGLFKLIQFENMKDMSVTPLRSGTSVALMFRLVQPKKALSIDVQTILPHWLMSSSFWQSPPKLK